MRLRNIAVLCVSTALTTGVGSAFAQGIITGSLTGTVQDPSAAVIPGAEITATNNATGVVNTLRSNQAGDFNFSALPVGTYTVIISSSGFSPLTLKNVGVSSGQVNGLGAEKLSTGSASETVEVSEAANLLETAQSQVSTTFDTQQVADLPVAGGLMNWPCSFQVLSAPVAIASQTPMALVSRRMVSVAARIISRSTASQTMTTPSPDRRSSSLTKTRSKRYRSSPIISARSMDAMLEQWSTTSPNQEPTHSTVPLLSFTRDLG